ncbi:MAG: S41 family peptidase [Defluviitaleaceae bacterium]|nr:S41 family peptidase [Defluviitaleaceae bacterium]
MRKIVLARLSALALVVSLAVPVPVQALSVEDRREITRAAAEIAAVMQNIIENYKGDITVQELYEAALEGISGALDEHSRYVSIADLAAFQRTMGSDMMFGISYFLNTDGRVEIESVMPGSPAQDAGIQRGDIITRVDGLDWYTGNFNTIAGRLAYPGLTRATFQVLREGDKQDVAITKAQVDLPTVLAVPASERVAGAPDHIGYILVERFTLGTPAEMSAAIGDFQSRGITHIILDLRYNPGGDRDSVTDISRMLVPDGVVYTTLDRRGRELAVRSGLAATPFAETVILTNGRTASASELLALAMREAGAATLVGTRTYGKGSIQTIFPLMRGDYFIFTTMEYFGRNGTRINNIGVAPDITVNIPAYLGGAIELDATGSSPRVPDVKRLLQHIGHTSGPIGDYLCAITRASIEELQEFHGLEPSGNIDEDTAHMLDVILRRELFREDAILEAGLQSLIGND